MQIDYGWINHLKSSIHLKSAYIEINKKLRQLGNQNRITPW